MPTFANKTQVLSLVMEAKMKEERISFICAAEDLQVPVRSIYCWCANLPLLSQNSTAYVGKARNHSGHEGFLDDIKYELISFVMQWRDRGLPVSCFAVLQKVTQMKPDFAEKMLPACYMCASCFLHQHNLVHQITTHTSQKPPKAAC
jgi:hypothetical protein